MKKISLIILTFILLIGNVSAISVTSIYYDGNSIEFEDEKIKMTTSNGSEMYCIFNTSSGIIEYLDMDIDISKPCEIYIPKTINNIPVAAIQFDALQNLYDGLPMWEEQIHQSKIYVPDSVKICSNITEWNEITEKNEIKGINYDNISFYCGYVVSSYQDFTICCTNNSSIYKTYLDKKTEIEKEYDSEEYMQSVYSKEGYVNYNLPIYEIISDMPKVTMTSNIDWAEYANYMAEKLGYNSGGEPVQQTESTLEPSPEQISNTVVTTFGATVSDWAMPEIELAFENNLIPQTMIDFDLTQKVNRGEFAAIALQLYDVLTNSETAVPSSCPFTDINGDINEIAIKKASSLDITNGISETIFEPVSFITREQLATMLCRVIKKYGFKDWTLATDSDYYLNTDGAKIFADDTDISDWARPSVYYMSLHGIVNGIDETHFAPKNTTTQQEASGYASATREQAIILAQRIFTKSDMLGN